MPPKKAKDIFLDDLLIMFTYENSKLDPPWKWRPDTCESRQKIQDELME